MNAEELRKAMINTALKPSTEMMINTALKPSTEMRLDWLEADASAQRTAILRLEREVTRLRIGGAVVAAVAGFLLGRAFL